LKQHTINRPEKLTDIQKKVSSQYFTGQTRSKASNRYSHPTHLRVTNIYSRKYNN